MAANSSNQTLQAQLEALSRKIRVDEEDMRKSKEVMQNVTQKLLNGLQREYGYVRNFEYTGSSYEGTKILEADEFDVMILLDGSLEGGLKTQLLTPGYGSLSPKNTSATVFKQFLSPGSQYLSPDLVARAFRGMVQTQLNKLGFSIRVNPSVHGPAVMLTITAHRTITVDLVPAFIVDGNFFVPKSYKSYAVNPGDKINGVPTSVLWRKSTSRQEKDMLSTIDRDKGCRRKCLKILKYIRTKESTFRCLTSFHFKTLVLRESQTGNWKDANMAERFLGLLQRLHDCLDQGRLEHKFIKKVNLLDGINPVTLDNMKNRVKKLISSEHARTQLLK